MIIATRQLKVRTSSSEFNMEVRLFKPTNEDGMWVCNYEIDWPGVTKKSFAAGADAIQAILLALKKIGIQLYTSDYHRNGVLYWNGSGGGYGFPVTSNLRDLLTGEDSNM